MQYPVCLFSKCSLFQFHSSPYKLAFYSTNLGWVLRKVKFFRWNTQIFRWMRNYLGANRLDLSNERDQTGCGINFELSICLPTFQKPNSCLLMAIYCGGRFVFCQLLINFLIFDLRFNGGRMGRLLKVRQKKELSGFTLPTPCLYVLRESRRSRDDCPDLTSGRFNQLNVG